MKCNKIIIYLATAILLIFTSCSNSLEERTASGRNYTVSGNISFAASNGAGPLILTASDKERTASVNFNDEHLTCVLYAYKYDDEGMLDRTNKLNVYTVDSNGFFIFAFEKKGRYKLFAELSKDGTLSGKGTVDVEITGYKAVAINIPVNPVLTEDGKIQLKISIDSSISSQIKRISVRWSDRPLVENFIIEDDKIMPGSPAEQELITIQKKMEKIRQGDFNKSFSVSGGNATIQYDAFCGGSWYAYLSFEDEDGNTLYSTREIINIYPGFTTNNWYGSSALSNGIFKVTGAMVNKYQPELVSNFPKILLWNTLYWNDEDDNEVQGRFYYLVDENSTGTFIPPLFHADSNPSSGADLYSWVKSGEDFPFTSRFFDSEGNIYLAQMSENKSGVSSTKSGWNEVQWSALNLNSEYARMLTTDYKTNIVYALEVDDVSKIIMYPDLISSNGASCTSSEITFDANFEANRFIVYDGKAYCFVEDEENQYLYYIYVVDVSTAGQKSILKMYTLDLQTVLGADTYLSDLFTDMLYQDGYIYFLYKESPTNFSKDIYTRGAVIRLNLLNGKIDSTGYTSNVLNKDEFMLRAFTNGEHYPLYLDNDLTQKFIPLQDNNEKDIKEYYPKICTPAENEKAFYGPTHFIAVKPKKLVISDEGLAFYMNDGELYCRNVNRIVYVDLDTFSISECKNIDSSLSLNKNYSSHYMVGSGSYIPVDATSTFYYKDDTDTTRTFRNDCVFIGLINGDYRE